jgi:hypothetical protein
VFDHFSSHHGLLLEAVTNYEICSHGGDRDYV